VRGGGEGGGGGRGRGGRLQADGMKELIEGVYVLHGVLYKVADVRGIFPESVNITL